MTLVGADRGEVKGDAMGPELFLLTILFSAAAAGISTYCLNCSKETKSFWGRKAEELYLEVDMLDRALVNFFDQSYSLVEASSKLTEADEAALAKAGVHFARIKMLTGFYFPAHSAALARAIAATATAHRALRGAQGAKEGDKAGLIESVDAAVCEVKDALDDLKTAILNHGRERCAPNPLWALWRARQIRGKRPGRALGIPLRRSVGNLV
jgi:hypothetical protein